MALKSSSCTARAEPMAQLAQHGARSGLLRLERGDGVEHEEKVGNPHQKEQWGVAHHKHHDRCNDQAYGPTGQARHHAAFGEPQLSADSDSCADQQAEQCR